MGGPGEACYLHCLHTIEGPREDPILRPIAKWLEESGTEVFSESRAGCRSWRERRLNPMASGLRRLRRGRVGLLSPERMPKGTCGGGAGIRLQHPPQDPRLLAGLGKSLFSPALSFPFHKMEPTVIITTQPSGCGYSTSSKWKEFPGSPSEAQPIEGPSKY